MHYNQFDKHHLLKMVSLMAVLALSIQWLSHRIIFSINTTTSLPQAAFLIIKGKPVTRRQYVAFDPPQNPLYTSHKPFIKIVGGIPGDTVSRLKTQYAINGHFMGLAKPISSKGVLLKPGPTGVLPKDEYFVYAPNPNSFDSRYQAMGWINKSRFIGRAYPVF
jgi:conjugal transfer pilin signal peptidase TrbI